MKTELAAHKKTVSKAETVAGQQSEKIEKPTEAKTLRSPRGALLYSIPRFIND